MKGFVFGTLIIIAGGLLVFPLRTMQVDAGVTTGICIVVCVIGFFVQEYSALKTEYDFWKNQKRKETEHKAVMQKAAELEKGGDPIEAINLLLGKIKAE